MLGFSHERPHMHAVLFALLISGLLCVSVTQLLAFPVADNVQENVLPFPCATDPDYREFERVQADAYLADKALNFRIMLDPAFLNEISTAAVKALGARTGRKNADIRLTPKDVQTLKAEIAQIRVPTCYENPLYFYLMGHLASSVDLARWELGLPAAEPPKFGSLPSNDINAYTYSTRNGRGNVIGINIQLLNFISMMASLAVVGVDPTMRKGTDSEAQIITEALIDISYSPQARDAFVSSILGLLLGRPVSKLPIDSSREVLVAFFAGAMERFVFAHEYGHVISRDTSSPIFVPTGVTGNAEHEVVPRSWAQELKADATGLKLLTQILRGSSADDPSAEVYFIYALKAPLFFFECMDLLERARFMLETHTMPTVPSEQEKAIVRDCVNDALSFRNKPCALEQVGTHPPAWLRKERLERTIRERLAQMPHRETAAMASQKADEMIFSIDSFWRETRQQLLEKIVKTANNQ